MLSRIRPYLRALAIGCFIGGCVVTAMGDIWHEPNIVIMGSVEVGAGILGLLFC